VSEEPTQIEVRDLTMAYGESVVQRDLCFKVVRGEIFVIIGDSGCGKSTLMRHMIGLKQPRSGDVFYADEPFWASDEASRDALKRRFGVLYQSAALFSSMTLAENVSLPLIEHANLPAPEAHEVARLKLALVGLTGFEEYYPAEVSGGMRKRAGLARAMALDRWTGSAQLPAARRPDPGAAGHPRHDTRRRDPRVAEHPRVGRQRRVSRRGTEADDRKRASIGVEGKPRREGARIHEPGAAVNTLARSSVRDCPGGGIQSQWREETPLKRAQP
jgi:predicted ABC-type transport system involved in lysophospholipase L1 biosynthesis ATPase subunit